MYTKLNGDKGMKVILLAISKQVERIKPTSLYKCKLWGDEDPNG